MSSRSEPTKRVRGSRFSDRRQAGRALARELTNFAERDPVVVALPRGGVPVGYEVAKALDAPLDIGLVRKLGAPMQPELGIGALGEGGQAVLDSDAVTRLRISREELGEIVEREQRELERRRRRYRPNHPPIDVKGRTVILVDDGLATGVTAVAAARVLRAQGARELILAVPVCPRRVGTGLQSEFDGFVCLSSPEPFYGVGGAYDDFTQTTDREVMELLAEANRHAGEAEPEASVRSLDGAGIAETELAIPAHSGVELKGALRVPENPIGLVIFVHGSGSSRLSPRNRAVAERLNVAGLATLLFDLLTEDEARARANVFDIDLLANRLVSAHRWVEGVPEVQGRPVGYFGASTGAAAALRAAAEPGERVAAVVSRGGRPDLAASALRRVSAPTLLIVGGQDRQVLELNRQAARMLGGPHELAVVPGAGHLFEEPGALEHVSRLAATWFAEHFATAPPPQRRRPTVAGERT
jgi:putative phosphoribosyl transferase